MPSPIPASVRRPTSTGERGPTVPPTPHRLVTPRRVVAAALLVLAVVWIRVNGPVEGRVLIEFTPDHGLTVADLPSLAAGAVAVLLAWPRRR